MMHGFDETKIPSFLLKKELIQCCMGNNEIVLNFFDGVSITISSLDEFISKNSEFIDSVAKFDKTYIGQKVERLFLGNKKTLVVGFSGGRNLMLTDDSDAYESIVFRSSGQVLVI